MKKLIAALLIALPGFLQAQVLTINLAFKHAQSVVFPGEELTITVQTKENGKPLNILPDALMINGVNNGNAEFGTVIKTGNSTYKYVAPLTMPSKPVIAIAASIKDAKGKKIIATKSINVIAPKWELKTMESTIYSCGSTNGGVAYTMVQMDICKFELGADLFVKASTTPSARLPPNIRDVSSCNPQLFSFEITPGRGELLTITSGKLNTTGGSISFMLNGKIETSDIGKKISLGGVVKEDSKPDEDVTTVPLSFPTPPLDHMTPHGFAPGADVNFWDQYTDNVSGNMRTRHWVYLTPLK
ncbi:hypothetical protein [Mucilaginibacter flavidus]|uniref:hypothetical protein n=1 Tax=Mucilaginibacter flavidus TaxID=2949309 RepID=UPI00209366BD|nr:hypothetical protein [Mucilaginibacter flavidus]MCO5948094.1 hypothetical protein [Mucilaginibacter flavidus]